MIFDINPKCMTDQKIKTSLQPLSCLGFAWLFKIIIYLFIWLLWAFVRASGIESPDQGWNPDPLNWEHRVLAIGSTGEFLLGFHYLVF